MTEKMIILQKTFFMKKRKGNIFIPFGSLYNLKPSFQFGRRNRID